MIMNLYREIDRDHIQFDFVVHSQKEGAYDQEIRILGGTIYHCPAYKGFNHFSYREWWYRFFGDHHLDYGIVHGHIGSTASIYLSAAKRYGVFTIAHSHSSFSGWNIRTMLYKTISYATRYVADYFFACSTDAALDRFGINVVNGSHFHIVPNSINSRDYIYTDKRMNILRQKYGISSKTLVIGHVGRFCKVKNHIFVLYIFKEILVRNTNSLLLLAGDGPLKHEMKDLAERLGIRKQVKFLGVRTDINDLMCLMDVFIFPSLYEGLPVALVEAQASGLPAVISDHIPKDSILIPELIKVMNLNESYSEWAAETLKAADIERKDQSGLIKKKGFDTEVTSRWLEDFYLEHAM